MALQHTSADSAVMSWDWSRHPQNGKRNNPEWK